MGWGGGGDVDERIGAASRKPAFWTLPTVSRLSFWSEFAREPAHDVHHDSQRGDGAAADVLQHENLSIDDAQRRREQQNERHDGAEAPADQHARTISIPGQTTPRTTKAVAAPMGAPAR